jgi:hypothetical protein
VLGFAAAAALAVAAVGEKTCPQMLAPCHLLQACTYGAKAARVFKRRRTCPGTMLTMIQTILQEALQIEAVLCHGSLLLDVCML